MNIINISLPNRWHIEVFHARPGLAGWRTSKSIGVVVWRIGINFSQWPVTG